MRSRKKERPTVKFRNLYFSKRPFLTGLFLEGLLFVGTYVRREIFVSNSIRLACRGKEIYHFCNVLLCIQGQIPSTSPPGAYIRRGYLTKGCLCYDLGGAHIWRGFYIKGEHRGAYFRNFKVCWIKSKLLTPTL